jgi:hypothetical protein
MLIDAAMTIRTKAAALVIAEPKIVRQRLKSLSPRSGRILQLALEKE